MMLLCSVSPASSTSFSSHCQSLPTLLCGELTLLWLRVWLRPGGEAVLALWNRGHREIPSSRSSMLAGRPRWDAVSCRDGVPAKMRANIKPARLRSGWCAVEAGGPSLHVFPNEANRPCCHLQAPNTPPRGGPRGEGGREGGHTTRSLADFPSAAFSDCCPIPACGLMEVGILGCLRHTTFGITEIYRGRHML